MIVVCLFFFLLSHLTVGFDCLPWLAINIHGADPCCSLIFIRLLIAFLTNGGSIWHVNTFYLKSMFCNLNRNVQIHIWCRTTP